MRTFSSGANSGLRQLSAPAVRPRIQRKRRRLLRLFRIPQGLRHLNDYGGASDYRTRSRGCTPVLVGRRNGTDRNLDRRRLGFFPLSPFARQSFYFACIAVCMVKLADLTIRCSCVGKATNNCRRGGRLSVLFAAIDMEDISDFFGERFPDDIHRDTQLPLIERDPRVQIADICLRVGHRSWGIEVI
jgi:hypothetical protein